MMSFGRMERVRNLLIAVIGCIGWGLLGHLVMTSVDGMFWPGWLIMTTALCVGAYSVDRLIEEI